MAHIASTYSAVLACLEIGTEAAFDLIDRKALYNFFMKCKNPSSKGSFLISEEGEADMRAVYIVVVISKIL